MSRVFLDEQLSKPRLIARLRKWYTVELLHGLRPGEVVLDDRVPQILLSLKQPTFLTIDEDFWDRRLCHLGYCILYFALRVNQQDELPDLLRALLRRPEFRTRAARMGKVARVSPARIDYWEVGSPRLTRVLWKSV